MILSLRMEKKVLRLIQHLIPVHTIIQK